jgi:hypothetical protein
VGPNRWSYKGRPIRGEARALLADAAIRAGETEGFVAKIPTQLDWGQFKPHIEALLWDAAGHCAEITEIDESIAGLRYAHPGTPQQRLLEELQERRDEHLVVVNHARAQLTHLASSAGNAAAAAIVALEHGTLHDLERASPSASALIADGGLEEAQTQLNILSQAWSEVDSSARLDALADELDADSGADTAKRRRPST